MPYGFCDLSIHLILNLKQLYRYRGVAFGLGTSPFLLGAVLHHHLQACDKKLSAVRALKRQRFVDDLISGAHTEQEVLQLCRDARKICCEAGFPFGKFHSNSSSVREQLQPSAVVSAMCHQLPRCLDLFGVCKKKICHLTFAVYPSSGHLPKMCQPNVFF